jgi:hypothetical protein
MWLRPGGEEGFDLTGKSVLGNFICIGWGAPEYQGLSDAALQHALKKHYEDKTKPGYVAQQMFRFLREIKPKLDYVVVPCYKRDEYYVGRIVGRVRVRTIEECGDVYSRRVKWVNPRSPWKKSALPKRFRQALRKRQTIWDLTEHGDFLKKLMRRPTEPDPRTPKDTGRFDTLSKAISYYLQGGRKIVLQNHKNFQVRLKRYLSLKGVGSKTFEKDLIDVRFTWKGKPYIGEIKVSSKHISTKALFRVAIGQILEYNHLKSQARDSQMVIFMDKAPDAPRIQLARRLGIAVVVEDRKNAYRLELPAPKGGSGLGALFVNKDRGCW